MMEDFTNETVTDWVSKVANLNVIKGIELFIKFHNDIDGFPAWAKLMSIESAWKIYSSEYLPYGVDLSEAEKYRDERIAECKQEMVRESSELIEKMFDDDRKKYKNQLRPSWEILATMRMFPCWHYRIDV